MNSLCTGVSLTDMLDRGMQHGFEILGKKISKRPRTVILICLVVAMVGGCGLIWTTVESDDDTLYLPKDSSALKDEEWAGSTFYVAAAEHTKSVSLYCISARKNTKNVLADEKGLLALFAMTEKLRNAGHMADYVKVNKYGEQLAQTPVAFWNNSKTIFLNDDDWRYTLAKRPETAYGMDSHISLGSILGEAKIEDDRVVSARAFQSKFWYTGDLPDSATRVADEAVEKASPINGELHCYLHSHTSYRDAVLSAISHDAFLVVVSVIALGGFATVCFALRPKPNPTGWRLGPAALLGIILSLLVSLGSWMASGGYFHSLMGAVLFLTLGLGIDDAFVIVDALDRVWLEADHGFSGSLDTGELVGRALASAGASILVTSVTDAAAFAACALTTNIPALRSFCAVASIAVAMDFVFQITWFVAFVAMETTIRIEIERRHRVEAILGGTSNHGEIEEDPQEDKPHRQNNAAASFRRRHLARGTARLIISPAGRCFSLLGASVLMTLGALGGTRLEMDYESKWMAPSDSMVRKAYDVEDNYFVKNNHWFVDLYSRDRPSNVLLEYLDDYKKAVTSLRNLNWFLSDQFWLDDSYWSNEALFKDAATLDASALHFATDAASRYAGDLAFRHGEASECSTTALMNAQLETNLENETLGLCATKVAIEWRKVERKATQIRWLDKAQKIIDDIHGARRLGIFIARSPTLEALSLTWNTVMKSVVLVALAVFICCFLLLGCRLWAAGLMLCIVACIDLVLVGSLYWIGEYCNMVTTVILTLAVGLSVDFSAHVCHAFLHAAPGQHRTARALESMLSPILKGGFSTLLAVLPMAYSESYVIRLFFYMVCLIILTGLFFGLLLLPALLHTFIAPMLRLPLFASSTARFADNQEHLMAGSGEPRQTELSQTSGRRASTRLFELFPSSRSSSSRGAAALFLQDEFYHNDDDDDTQSSYSLLSDLPSPRESLVAFQRRGDGRLPPPNGNGRSGDHDYEASVLSEVPQYNDHQVSSRAGLELLPSSAPSVTTTRFKF